MGGSIGVEFVACGWAVFWHIFLVVEVVGSSFEELELLQLGPRLGRGLDWRAGHNRIAFVGVGLLVDLIGAAGTVPLRAGFLRGGTSACA